MNDPRFYERKLVATGDGSHSIYLPAFDEHYHSTHGALRESLHVFIKHGYEELIYKVSARLRILEMGFGTGLNALLTWERNRHVAVSVDYTSLEAFPVDASTAAQLNYPGELKSPDGEEIFMKMHTCPWEVKENFGSNFSLLKLETTLADFQPEGQYDLVYYDAFAPRVQPELWTRDVFEKLFACMCPGSLLVTYCAKGEVKRNLKAAGFLVETVPGPPGKREMTRAKKP